MLLFKSDDGGISSQSLGYLPIIDMLYSRILFLLMFTILLPLQGAEPLISIGADYKEVMKALGKPDGDLSAGSRRILTYGDAKVTMTAGKVTAISPEFENKFKKRNTARDSIDAKRGAGLVNYKGKWVTPSQQTVQQNAERAAQQAAKSKASKTVNSGGWYTDFKQASVLAKSQNRKLLINFTGSDWCGWCIKLDKEVFATAKFRDYAAKNYVVSGRNI